MPKKQVVEFECDRCGRKWYADPKEQEHTPSLQLRLVDPSGEPIEEARYEVMCDSCASAVLNYVSSITKELKKQSPKRGAKEEEGRAPSSPETR
jgi:hypothetical protein